MHTAYIYFVLCNIEHSMFHMWFHFRYWNCSIFKFKTFFRISMDESTKFVSFLKSFHLTVCNPYRFFTLQTFIAHSQFATVNIWKCLLVYSSYTASYCQGVSFALKFFYSFKKAKISLYLHYLFNNTHHVPKSFMKIFHFFF